MDNVAFKAVYGIYNLNMELLSGFDVTDKVKALFVNGNELTIPSNFDFNKAFGDPVFGKRKFLQIITPARIHNIIEDRYDYPIEINLLEKTSKVTLVYYAYIDQNSNWQGIISGQLVQLKSYGLLDESIYIHVCDVSGKEQEVVSFIKKIAPKANLSFSTENLFEYPAIKLVHRLATESPENIFLYLHTKGMSYRTHSRKAIEIALLTKTFEDWRAKIQIFKNGEINKIGLFPAIGDNMDKGNKGTRGGWIWFNFWYARGKYIINCEEPGIQENRYFFEHWLGLQKGNLIINDDCYNLYRVDKRSYFTPSQASLELENLTKLTLFKL